jgi:hypothetical protein
LTDAPPPIQPNSFIAKSSLEELEYAQLKQILLDWTATVAKASIDGTRSAEDAAKLRPDLARQIRIPSGSPLIINEVEKELMMFNSLTGKVSGSDVTFHLKASVTRLALDRGASQKDFGEWAYGGLGKALDKQVESILGRDWEYSKGFRVGNDDCEIGQEYRTVMVGNHHYDDLLISIAHLLASRSESPGAFAAPTR